MRISDWSSDLCSSDLADALDRVVDVAVGDRIIDAAVGARGVDRDIEVAVGVEIGRRVFLPLREQIGAALVEEADADQARRREIIFARQVERPHRRSEEHTSELQSLMRISYAVF